MDHVVSGCRRRAGSADPESPERRLDVFQGTQPHVLGRQVDPTLDLGERGLRNAYAAGGGKAFQPGRDVHAITKYVVTFHDDITDIDTDAVFDSLARLEIRVAVAHGLVNLDAAANRVDHAGKLHQQAIAHGLDDAAAKSIDRRIDMLLLAQVQRVECAFLVGTHHP